LAASRTNDNLLIYSRQRWTLHFWEESRHNCKLFASPVVLEECSLGDPDAARRRLAFLAGMSVLGESDQMEDLTAAYQKL
jgi:hypothetical protein